MLGDDGEDRAGGAFPSCVRFGGAVGEVPVVVVGAVDQIMFGDAGDTAQFFGGDEPPESGVDDEPDGSCCALVAGADNR